MVKIRKIGLIGCGMMGKGIAKNLVTKGYTVRVYDRNPAVIEWSKTIGAIPNSSPREIGQESDVVITSLPSPEIVKDVLLSDDGVLQSLKPNSFILDMSTIDPVTSQDLYHYSKERDVHFFDCPVSGGPEGAERGTLTIMVGGDETYLPSVRPILEAMGKDIIYLGGSGSGQIAKLCHNMLVATIIAGLAEAFTVGAKAGVSPHKLAQVINSGAAHNRVLFVFGQNMLQGTYEEVKFSLTHMHKDINLYTKTASSFGVPSLVGVLINQLFEIAKANGKGNLDSSAIFQTIQEMANIYI